MHKLTKVILAGLCLSAPAFCQDTVLHTFKPNTPAKAAEVNENFQTVMQKAKATELTADDNTAELTKVRTDLDTLMERPEFTESDQTSLQDLDGRVRRLKVGSSGGNSYPTFGIDFTHKPEEVEIGQTVEIGGATHVIVKVPYFEPVSGARYDIQFPARSENGVLMGRLDLRYKTRYTQQVASSLIHLIDSYSSGSIVEVDREISIDNSSGDLIVRSELGDVHFSLMAMIGDTLVSFPSELPDNLKDEVGGEYDSSGNWVEQQVTAEENDRDFTDDLSKSMLISRYIEVVTQFVQEYVNYIEIEEK